MLDLVKLYREATHSEVASLGYSMHTSAYGVMYVKDSVSVGPEVEACLSIGVFDGVHKGHQMLIKHMMDEAKAEAVNSIIMTFDPDPMEVIVGPQLNAQLQEVPYRINSLLALEPSVLYVLHFDQDMKDTSYQDFFAKVVGDICKLKTLHVGSNFRVGRGAQGNVEALQALGKERGFSVVGHELLLVDGKAVSASRIRKLISEGELDEAYGLLDHVLGVSGTVQKGRGQGRLFGFATANIDVWDRAILPKDGVYAAFARLNNKLYPAAINVGKPPMFEGSARLVETHIIGFTDDIYGESLEVFFVSYMRDSIKFDTIDALISQVESDILWVQENVSAKCVEVF